MLRRDDDVRLAQQVEGATAGHAVDRGDDRLPQLLAARSDELARVVVGVRVEEELLLRHRDLATVDPRAERLVASGGEHDRPHVVVDLDRLPHVTELALHGLVERIVALRPVQRDDSDMVAFFVLEGFQFHRAAPVA